MVKLECQLKSENKACHEPIIVIEKIHHIQRRGTLKRQQDELPAEEPMGTLEPVA